MKKEFSFNYEDDKYILLDKGNDREVVFSIDAQQLQFDTLSYYEAIFKDVSESVEISIDYIVDATCGADENIIKSSKYIFDTVKSLTDEICMKINEECFSVPEDELQV